MKKDNRDALIIAYYLARFNEDAYKNLGHATQTATHKFIGRILDLPDNTIKNMRDEFDPFYENGRNGWNKRLPSRSRMDIVLEYQNYDQRYIEEQVKDILGLDNSMPPSFSNHRLMSTSSDAIRMIEGELVERKVLSRSRNYKSVLACKERDSYTCQSCGFFHEYSIVECHHLKPLFMIDGSYEIDVNDLITLCPTCHSLAHYLLRKSAKYMDKDSLLFGLSKAIAREN